jgi:D-alanyl-lipoteichoic acid acyltransferase DltB (MBOAT superfamily)
MLSILPARLPWSFLIVTFIAYPAMAWLVLRVAPAKQRSLWFGVVNLLGSCAAFSASLLGPQRQVEIIVKTVEVASAAYLVILLFVVIHYICLRRSANNSKLWAVVATWLPIAVLIALKYIPLIQRLFGAVLADVSVDHLSILFVGLSYLTFRLVHVVQEVQNGVVEMPTISEYLSFAFFVPTLSLGPINPYSRYINSYRNPIWGQGLVQRSLLRVMVGFTKYIFLATVLNQYTYSGLILDGHPHHKVDFFVALFAYTLYLYCNFSGFCDMVVGMSGLLGIDVMENFNTPFVARNLQEFWTRWHISLSTWLRDLMFTPLVKSLVRIFGPKSTNHVIAFSVCAVFVVIGVWHGFGVNFAVFGLFHGIGLATVHYYGIGMKKLLGKQKFLAYRENRFIGAIGTGMTFLYFSISLFAFANSWNDMWKIIGTFV